MIDSDRKRFGELMKDFMSIYRATITAGQIKMWWEDLDPYPFEAVEQAFRQYRKTSQRQPVPASILEFLPDPNGHPAPEEAWNKLPKSDSEGGYVTNQMMAAYGACSDSLERGDTIGARMAFIESYKREVAHARLVGERAKFWYSGANDLDFTQRRIQQEKHTLEAEARGWLTRNRSAEIIAAIGHDLGRNQDSSESQQTQKRLTASGSPEISEKLRRLSESLSLTSQQKEGDKQAHIKRLLEG